jgi:hypothetical protein
MKILLKCNHGKGVCHKTCNFQCPKCGRFPSRWTLKEKGPRVFNQILSDETGCQVYEWEEIHRCWCWTKYLFINSNA